MATAAWLVAAVVMAIGLFVAGAAWRARVTGESGHAAPAMQAR
jgi:hypothetical protein